MHKEKIFSILYIVLAVLYLLNTLFFQHPQMAMFIKPLFMPLLIAHYISNTEYEKLRYAILLALFFSGMGDTLLLWGNEPLFFMAGLGSFLLAHLSYIWLFHKQGGTTIRWNKLIVPFSVLYGLLFFYHLYPHLGDMKLPVGVYAVVLTTMMITAFFRRSRPYSFLFVFVGAVLFVISDSLLAESKFVQKGSGEYNFWVMLTYLTAQFFIIKGLLIGSKSKNSAYNDEQEEDADDEEDVAALLN